MDVTDPAGDATVRVLVVDDEARFLDLAEEVLRTAPEFEAVGRARSGEAALRWLRGAEADLVLMDVRMPGMGGVEAAREIAALEGHPVVVLCSSDQRPDIAADPRAHGADAFSCKERVCPGLLREVWHRSSASSDPGDDRPAPDRQPPAP